MVNYLDLHCHSKALHGAPGGAVAQLSSSVPSPQSSSLSHLQVLRMQRPLPHWNSLGSQPPSPKKY